VNERHQPAIGRAGKETHNESKETREHKATRMEDTWCLALGVE